MLDQVKGLQGKLKKLREEAELSKKLALDLRADRFPSFVLEKALQALAEDGSSQLNFLSSGRYSFSLNKRDFWVIDHWNENEVRSCKTLSGGETFIASLSLALALADRIYQLGSQMGGELLWKVCL